MRTAFIGLGSMGGDLVEQIVQAGIKVALYDVYPGAMERFHGRARLATSPMDAARDANIVQICVRGDRQARAALFVDQGLVAAPGGPLRCPLSSPATGDENQRQPDTGHGGGTGGVEANPPGRNPDYDALMASHQAGIGEKDLELAVACGRSAGLNMDMALQARALVRPTFDRTANRSPG